MKVVHVDIAFILRRNHEDCKLKPCMCCCVAYGAGPGWSCTLDCMTCMGRWTTSRWVASGVGVLWLRAVLGPQDRSDWHGNGNGNICRSVDVPLWDRRAGDPMLGNPEAMMSCCMSYYCINSIGSVNGFVITLMLFTKQFAYPLYFYAFQIRNRLIRARAERPSSHERGSSMFDK